MLNLIKYHQTTLIKVPTKFMYNIVCDVDKYSQFLPGCSKSITYNHKLNYFEGELEIDYKLFKSAYISKVYLETTQTNQKIISISENNNVFKMLKSIWTLTGNNHYCNADYSIEFLFKNPFFQHASSLLLKEIVNSTSKAFEQRAYVLYKQEAQTPSKQGLNDQEQKLQNKNNSILHRLLQKQLISNHHFNIINQNNEIINSINQISAIYSNNEIADIKCAEFINEYLIQQQQFKI